MAKLLPNQKALFVAMVTNIEMKCDALYASDKGQLIDQIIQWNEYK